MNAAAMATATFFSRAASHVVRFDYLGIILLDEAPLGLEEALSTVNNVLGNIICITPFFVFSGSMRSLCLAVHFTYAQGHSVLLLGK